MIDVEVKSVPKKMGYQNSTKTLATGNYLKTPRNNLPTLSIIDSDSSALADQANRKTATNQDLKGVKKLRFDAVNASMPHGAESDRVDKLRKMMANDSQATIKTILTPRKEIRIETQTKSPQIGGKNLNKKMSMKQIGSNETPSRYTKAQQMATKNQGF